MTHVLRIAHLRIALHVANPEVGNREVHRRCYRCGTTTTTNKQKLKIELLSQWKLEAESRN